MGRGWKGGLRGVPNSDPGLDAVARSAQSALVLLWRARDQLVKQFPSHWTMTVTIELDMPLDVVDEMTQASLVVLHARERFLQPAEHLGDDVLAAIKKCRDNLFRRPRLGQCHRMRDKGSDMRWHARPHQPAFDRRTDSRQRAKRFELAGTVTAAPPRSGLEGGGS